MKLYYSKQFFFLIQLNHNSTLHIQPQEYRRNDFISIVNFKALLFYQFLGWPPDSTYMAH